LEAIVEVATVKTVESLDVLNRKGEVFARFQGERGPEGCGIVTLMMVGGTLHRVFRVVPPSTKDSELSALCRKEAGFYVRLFGDYTMKVVPENKLKPRELHNR
jgi:hypothetical protein